MVGDGVHHGGEGDDMASHNEDGEEQLTKTEELTAKATHDDLASVCEVVDVRVTGTELANGVTGVEGNDTKTDDDDDGAGETCQLSLMAKWLEVNLRHQTNGSQSSWQREHTQRDGFSDHEHAALPPLQRLVLDGRGLIGNERVDIVVVDGLDRLQVVLFQIGVILVGDLLGLDGFFSRSDALEDHSASSW